MGKEEHSGVPGEGPSRPHAAAGGRRTAEGLALGELRATYPTLGFPQYAGEVGSSDADSASKARAQDDAAAAIAAPLEAYRAFFLDGKQFIGGDPPSIADIRLAATLEFLNAIDYDFPTWVTEYLTALESTLGEAYSEPAADVRGYVASMKAPAP